MKKFKYVVFMGRFQPFHNGHISVLETAFRHSEKIIVLIGSANCARSPHNIWSYQEREKMLIDLAANRAILDDYHHVKVSTPREPDRTAKIIVRPINDYLYRDDAWLAHVQKTVHDAILDDMNESKNVTINGLVDAGDIGLIGYSKDHSSYYLNMFPNWKSVNVETQYGTISSTDLRNLFLSKAPIIPQTHLVPHTIASMMAKFALTEEFKWLVKEREFYDKYKQSWALAPYPPTIMCVDAVVVQGGNILLVRRGAHPGKGLLALPGGHVEPKETCRTAAVRELREETRIADAKGEIPPAMLNSFITEERLFDDPDRSQRGRVLTMAYLFRLPQSSVQYTVRGDDDAASAHWYPLGELSATNFHDDHAAIISLMTGTEIV